MCAIKLSGAAAILLTLTAVSQADETKGTIKSVDTGRKEVVLKGIVKDSIYEVTPGGTIWLDGAKSKLANLAADDRAVIVYQKNGEHMMASQVRALRNAQETTGTVKDVFMEKREITLKGTIKNTTYELNKGGTVWVDGKLGSLSDIRDGDQVLITYEQRGDHWMANDVTVTKRK